MDKIEIEVDVRSDGRRHRVDLEVANYRSDEVVVRLAHPLPDGLARSAVSPLSGSLADSWAVSGDGLVFEHEVDWASAIQTGYVARGVDRAAIEAAFDRAAVAVQKPDGHEVGTLTGLEPRFTEAVSLGAADDRDGDTADPTDGAGGESPAPASGDDPGTEAAGRPGEAGFDPDQPWETLDGPAASVEPPGDGGDGHDGEPARPAADGDRGPDGSRNEESLPANVSAYVLDGLPDDLPASSFSWTEIDGRVPSSQREPEDAEPPDRSDGAELPDRSEDDGERDDGDQSTRAESGGLLTRVRSWF
jgi:hypothetical protein